jgi:GT2 family glycosyltransferase
MAAETRPADAPPAVAASVIVPAHGAAATVGATVRSLREQRFDGAYEVLVVIDHEERRTTFEAAERAREGDRRVRLVELRQRVGSAGARNLGAQQARAPLLAFTDADCVPAPEWLAAGVGALEAADLVQGSVRPQPGVPVGPFDRTLVIDRETGLYETANLFVRRETFERVGGFEAFVRHDVPPMGEDVLFGWRARATGARTAFCEGAAVFHAVFPRGAGGFVAERFRLRYFPALAERIPQLRREVFFARAFLSRRTAAFDLALGAAAAMLLARRLSPAVIALPYIVLAARQSRHWGRRAAPRVALAQLAADAVGAAALAAGSVRYRSPVL